MNAYYIYIVASEKNGTIYIGITNDLERRVFEHKNEIIRGFTKKYKCKKLLYFEHYTEVEQAIAREKQLKNWHRDWKLNLIKIQNPNFIDLSIDWFRKDAETSSA